MEETLCPTCGGPMVSRANKASGQRFWGCKNYPTCKGTRNTDGEAPLWRNDDVGEMEPFTPSDRQRMNDKGRWRNQ